MKQGPARVYPITDKRLAGTRTHLAVLRELVRGGATFVQLRDKLTPAAELLPDILRCVEFAAARGVTVVLNDRCDLVMASGAPGVHLGQEDLPPSAARRLLGPHRLIGFSTHNLRQVARAATLPVDYIGFGPVFETSTKNRTSPVTGLAMLARACRKSAVPVVAIGGIGRDRILPVLEAGAAGAAVVSSVMVPGEIARRMESLLRIAEEFDRGRPRTPGGSLGPATGFARPGCRIPAQVAAK